MSSNAIGLIETKGYVAATSPSPIVSRSVTAWSP